LVIFLALDDLNQERIANAVMFAVLAMFIVFLGTLFVVGLRITPLVQHHLNWNADDAGEGVADMLAAVVLALALFHMS
jgi:hypothetical protein